jgi:hypothetical protein
MCKKQCSKFLVESLLPNVKINHAVILFSIIVRIENPARANDEAGTLIKIGFTQI